MTEPRIIALTQPSGEAVHVNLSTVCYFKATGSGGVRLEFNGLAGIIVNESLAQVLALLQASDSAPKAPKDPELTLKEALGGARKGNELEASLAPVAQLISIDAQNSRAAV